MNINIICGILLMSCLQCNSGDTYAVDDAYKRNNQMLDTLYQKDSIELYLLLKEQLKNKKASFYSSEYSDSTSIFIDSIVYSPSRDKIALFVITRTSTSQKTYKNPVDSESQFYYDAYCYLGKKDTGKSAWSIRWFNSLNLSNFYNYQDATRRIRWKYFHELSTIKDTSGNSLYKYNIGHENFWDGPAWRKYFSDF